MRRSVLVVALALAGCSLTTSLAGFSGGPDDAADAGDASGGGEAGGEGSGGDASGRDAPGDAPGEAGSGLCSGQPATVKLCDDFEGRTTLQGPWDSVSAQAPASVVLETGASGQQGHAFFDAVASGPYFEAEVSKTFAFTALSLTYSYTVRVDAPPAKGGVQLMNVDIEQAGGNHTAVFLIVTPGGVAIAQQFFPAAGSPVYQQVGVPSFTYGVAHRASVHLDLDTSPTRITYTLDGVQVVDVPGAATLTSGTPSIIGGIDYSDVPGGPCSIHFDDVVFELVR